MAEKQELLEAVQDALTMYRKVDLLVVYTTANLNTD